MAFSNSKLGPLQEGRYVATNLQTGFKIGYDHFVIRELENDLLIESQHTVFGTPNMVQVARFTVGKDWTPYRLEVDADGGQGAIIDFKDNETILYTRSPQGAQQMRFPIGRQRAYLLLNSAFYFPLHIVRRFRFDDPTPQQFEVIPPGICEVRQLQDVIEDEQRFRLLQMQLVVEGTQDIVDLVVDSRGNLLRYQTKNLSLLVKLEEGES